LSLDKDTAGKKEWAGDLLGHLVGWLGFRPWM